MATELEQMVLEMELIDIDKQTNVFTPNVEAQAKTFAEVVCLTIKPVDLIWSEFAKLVRPLRSLDE